MNKLKNYAITGITMLLGMIATTAALILLVWWAWIVWEIIKFTFSYSWIPNPF